jgi:hypothetical protein
MAEKLSQNELSASNPALSTNALTAKPASVLDSIKQWWMKETSGDRFVSNAFTMLHASVFAGSVLAIRHFGQYLGI